MTPEEYLESKSEHHEGGGWYAAIPLEELGGQKGVVVSIAAGEVGPRMYAFSEPLENLPTLLGYRTVEVALLQEVKQGIIRRERVVRRRRPKDVELLELEPYYAPHQEVMGHVPVDVVLGIIRERLPAELVSNQGAEREELTELIEQIAGSIHQNINDTIRDAGGDPLYVEGYQLAGWDSEAEAVDAHEGTAWEFWEEAGHDEASFDGAWPAIRRVALGEPAFPESAS